jgi:hypothetical protein
VKDEPEDGVSKTDKWSWSRSPPMDDGTPWPAQPNYCRSLGKSLGVDHQIKVESAARKQASKDASDARQPAGSGCFGASAEESLQCSTEIIAVFQDG